jgi:hypothetical protein
MQIGWSLEQTQEPMKLKNMPLKLNNMSQWSSPGEAQSK